MLNTIKIDGKEFPINFGWNAVRAFVAETGIQTLNLEKWIVSRIDYTLLAIYLGVKEGYRRKGEQFELSIEQFVDLFDNDPDAISIAIKTMANQLAMLTPKKKGKQSKNVKAPKQN